MYKNNSFLAIVPARSGSKGLPGKNIKELCGKPMIAYTIEQALRSKYINDVINFHRFCRHRKKLQSNMEQKVIS